MILTEYAKRIALFEAEVYRPLMVAKMLKSEGIFVSRRGVAKFYQEFMSSCVGRSKAPPRTISQKDTRCECYINFL